MEISLMQYFTNLFFHMLMSNRIWEPNVTDLCRLSEALLLSEHEEHRDNDWKNMMKEINYIYENTHEDIKTHLAIIELSYFKNMQRGLNQNIEITSNEGIVREYNTPTLYKYIDMVPQRLVRIIMKVASKYALEIPLGKSFAMSGVSSDEKGDETPQRPRGPSIG